MLERSLELHISIARNGVRPVLPRRGLNPAARRSRCRDRAEPNSGASKKVSPGSAPRRGFRQTFVGPSSQRLAPRRGPELQMRGASPKIVKNLWFFIGFYMIRQVAEIRNLIISDYKINEKMMTNQTTKRYHKNKVKILENP